MSNIASTNENVTIGRRLATLRQKLGFSQRDFAEKLEVSLRAYQNYERGEREIPAGLIRALYEVFRVQPVWLLLGGDDPLRDRGEIDPTLAEAIAWEFGAAVEEVRSRDLVLFPSWPLLGYRLALIYNRVIKRLKPGESFGDAIAEEVRFLRDLAIHDAVPGAAPKIHPEELRHFDKIGVTVDEVYSPGAAPMDRRREISVEVDGQRHAGYYVIEGKKKLSLTVHYKDQAHTDARIYRPDQLKIIEAVAAQLLREMVTGTDLAEKKPAARQIGKKRPTTSPRRRHRDAG